MTLLGSLILVGTIGGWTGSAIQAARPAVMEIRDVKVLANAESLLPGYSYWMEYENKIVGRQKFFARFCPDKKPAFDPGDYLNLLRYGDHSLEGCWSLTDKHTGFFIRRDHAGRTDSEVTHETASNR